MPLSPLEVALTGLFGHKPACLAELKDIISLLCKYGPQGDEIFQSVVLVRSFTGLWHHSGTLAASFFTRIFLVLLSLCKSCKEIFPL